MTIEHPIVAITGSSGAGTTSVKHAFHDIFRREGLEAAFVEGDAFLRFEREAMQEFIKQAQAENRLPSHFGPEANLFERLEALFEEYGRTGTGQTRHYVTEETAAEVGLPVGTFTPWRPLPPDTHLLFYEGLHGGVAAHSWMRRRTSPAHQPWLDERRNEGNHGVNIAQRVDLLIGVVPVVNLEWIQKIHRDTRTKGQSAEAVTATILRRMRDYVHFIVPQFSLTDINFQRVPVVDTSNPFIARDVPTLDESIVVIHFRDPQKFDFPNLLRRIPGSFMSRLNSIVVPGGKMGLALEIICTPLIHELCDKKQRRPGEQAV